MHNFFLYTVYIYMHIAVYMHSVINDYCEPTPRQAWEDQNRFFLLNDLHDIKVVYMAPVKGSKNAIQ